MRTPGPLVFAAAASLFATIALSGAPPSAWAAKPLDGQTCERGCGKAYHKCMGGCSKKGEPPCKRSCGCADGDAECKAGCRKCLHGVHECRAQCSATFQSCKRRC